MSVEEVKDGDIVHHITLGRAVIAEVNEDEKIVVLHEPGNVGHIRVERFSNLHRLEMIEDPKLRIKGYR